MLSVLNTTACGLAKVLGAENEIVVHDLEKMEIAYIYNGYITGRTVGYKINPSIYDTILSLLDKDGHSVGYASHSVNGKKLRSSHFLFKDDDGVAKGLLCINQDTSKLEAMRDCLNDMLHTQTMGIDVDQNDDNYIQYVTRRVIMDTIEKQKPSALDTREGKLEVIKKLENRGVFMVRDSVPTVCKLLSISQATLYNHLRDIRSDSAPIPVRNDIVL